MYQVSWFGRDRGRSGLDVGELLAFGDQLFQQGRGLEGVAHGGLEALHLGQHLLQHQPGRLEHRAAAVDRPAVNIDPDYVDVGGADRLALFEDLRSLIDHRIGRNCSRIFSFVILRGLAPDFDDETPLITFSVTGDLAGVASSHRSRSSQRRPPGRGGPASQSTSRMVIELVRLFLRPSRCPGPARSAHGERTHRKAEVVEHTVDVPGH